MKETMQKMLVFGHRGAPREAPENTLAALRKAFELGADGVEVDCLLTRDRVPIVTHNDDLSVLTSYQGYAHATPFATIASLDVGLECGASWFGTTIPTLSEVLDIIAHYDARIIIELKHQPGTGKDLAELVGGIVTDVRLRHPPILSSFSPFILWQLKRKHPKLCRAVIIGRKLFARSRRRLTTRYLGICRTTPSLHALSRGMVRDAHAEHQEVYTWTVNTPRDIDRCIALGSDGIITDDIAMARAHLSSLGTE